MNRLILLLLLGIASCFALLAHVSWEKKAELREKRLAKQAKIVALQAAPAYLRLIERGSEVCQEQEDVTIWACGATIRMPAPGPSRSSRGPLCSSPDAPIYVGSFLLPEIVSGEPITEGQRLRPNISGFGSNGSYHSVGSWDFMADDLPAFTVCGFGDGSPCAGLRIAGNTDFSLGGRFSLDEPHPLLRERPPPETIAYENHTSEIDAFLDLDGAPVAHVVGLDYSDGSFICSFHFRHPLDGYLVELGLDCDLLDDWRGLLRGIIAELSDRTVDTTLGARCDVPPPHSRVRPLAHRLSLDQNQAMHDWVVD